MSYEPSKADDDTMEASYAFPNVTVNRFLLTRLDTGSVRIAVGESRTPQSPINFRGAMLMTPYQAWELTKIIQALLGDEYSAFEKGSKTDV